MGEMAMESDTGTEAGRRTSDAGRRAALRRVNVERSAEPFLLGVHSPRVWKPTASTKRAIAAAGSALDAVVAPSGCDLVRTDTGERPDDAQLATAPGLVRRFKLLEVKGTEAQRVGPRFERMFFSRTEVELANARAVPDNFRFVLVKPTLSRELWLTGEELVARAPLRHARWAVTLR